MSKIQIFLATYNRPQLIVNTINSILNQTYKDFELIVSDNSTNNNTRNLLKQHFSNEFIYRKRTPSLNAIDHFNKILSEVTSEYFMVFHDDDQMLPNMLNTLMNCFLRSDKIVAVGSNAFFNRNGKDTKKTSTKIKRDFILSSKETVIDQYFNRKQIVPFPSYLYKKIISDKMRFNYNYGGKHCDVSFIMDIINLGSILWSPKPLMSYFIHEDQDTKTHVFEDRIKLINYITKTTTYSNRDGLILKYRVFNLYGELKKNIINGKLSFRSKRYFKLLKILFMYSFFNYFIKALAITILSINKSHFIRYKN